MSQNLLSVLCITALMMGCEVSQKRPEKIDACSLFTKSEIEAALGTTVKDGERTFYERDVSACQYATGGQPARVEVLQPALTKRNPAPGRDLLKKVRTEKGEPPQVVSGVGEAAVWDGRTLHFVKNDIYVMISADSLETAKTLALKATSRL